MKHNNPTSTQSSPNRVAPQNRFRVSLGAAILLALATSLTNAGTIDPLIAHITTPSQYITKVEFYYGDVLIGMVTNGANGLYTNSWTALTGCDCGFTATAYDAIDRLRAQLIGYVDRDRVHIINPGETLIID